MGMKVWSVVKLLLLAAGIALIVRADLAARKSGLRLRPTSSELSDVLADADLTGFQEKPLPHYPGFVTEGGTTLKAAAVNTAQVSPRVKGFVDEVSVLVAVDESGKVLGARILSHRETPYYMKMILDSDLLERIAGRDLRDGFEDIDAVTGATVTAQAIIEDIKTASITAGSELYGLDIDAGGAPGLKSTVSDPKFIALVVTLLLGLTARYLRFPRWRRDAVYVLSIVTIGFYLNTPYSLVHTFQFASLNLPGASNPGLVALAVFILATTLFSGPLYCGYLCPFGGLQDILYRVSPNSWRWQVSSRVLKLAREIRYIILFICVLGFFVLGVGAFSEVEPFSHLFALTGDFAPWLLVAAALVFSMFVKRFWCRFLCPTGACLVMLSAHRRFIRHVRRGLEDSEIDPAAEQAEGAGGKPPG